MGRKMRHTTFIIPAPCGFVKKRRGSFWPNCPGIRKLFQKALDSLCRRWYNTVENKAEHYRSHPSAKVARGQYHLFCSAVAVRRSIVLRRGEWSLRFVIFIWRCLPISKQELLINEEIRDREVRVIDADGSQLGLMSARDAQKIAYEKNLDLVKIAPNAQPPVCRIMDYGKYRFEQSKREKEARKNQRVVDIKEIRLSLNIDTNDFNTKLGHAKRFLKDGDRVKVSIRFRGREMAHASLGTALMTRFAEACAEEGSVDKIPKLEGRSMIMFLTAKPSK